MTRRSSCECDRVSSRPLQRRSTSSQLASMPSNSQAASGLQAVAAQSPPHIEVYLSMNGMGIGRLDIGTSRSFFTDRGSPEVFPSRTRTALGGSKSIQRQLLVPPSLASFRGRWSA